MKWYQYQLNKNNSPFLIEVLAKNLTEADGQMKKIISSEIDSYDIVETNL